MKINYKLLTLAALFIFLSGCGAAYYSLHDISDSHNQYYKHELPHERQSFESYQQEREKILKEEQVAEEQKILNLNRAISHGSVPEVRSDEVSSSSYTKSKASGTTEGDP